MMLFLTIPQTMRPLNKALSPCLQEMQERNLQRRSQTVPARTQQDQHRRDHEGPTDIAAHLGQHRPPGRRASLGLDRIGFRRQADGLPGSWDLRRMSGFDTSPIHR